MEKGGSIEVHFNNFKYVDYADKTKSENIPLKVFSDIFNILYWYGLPEKKPIIFHHEDAERLKLYQTILDKIIKKHSLKWMCVKVSNDQLVLEPLPEKGFFEKFIG